MLRAGVIGAVLACVGACKSPSKPAGEPPATPPPPTTPASPPAAPPPAAGSGFLAGVQQVVVGRNHSCALVGGGAVYCWGDGSQGQLGRGSWDPSPVPVRVAGIDQATALAAGLMHTCALLATGRVMCWGAEHAVGAGDGSMRARTQPGQVPDLDDAVELVATDFTSCARRKDGSVVCWGRNLGKRPYGPGPDTDDVPRAVDGMREVHQLAAGGLHLCAIQGADRALVCLGIDHGIGPLGRFDDPLVVRPSPWTGVEVLVTTSDATCFRRAGGWRCWGSNAEGRLDPALQPDDIAPADAVTVLAGKPVTSFLLAEHGGCTIDAAGVLACWTGGTIGSGSRVEQLEPVASAALGLLHTCAVDRHGGVHCWGKSERGSLGDGATADRLLPVRVVAPPSTAPVALAAAPAPTGRAFTADRIAAGYDETCALRDGEVWCWGEWQGRPFTDPLRLRTRPRRIEGLPARATDLAAAFGFMCARVLGGAVWCWGENDRGQLGDGTRHSALAPVAVKGLGDAKTLALGISGGCALRSNDQVACWGEQPPGDMATLGRYHGQIGQLVLGGGHICFLLRTSTVQCQGGNSHGQLGNGEGGCEPDPQAPPCGPHSRCKRPDICASSATFVKVPGLRDVRALALGDGTTCALRDGGKVSCWGNGSQGRLGVGEPVATVVKTPTEIPGLTGVLSLASFGSHTCAVLGDHTAACWGQNVWGELGDRSNQYRPAPTPVHGLTQVSQISPGMSHTCALRADRTVWCWGKNDRGILGTGIDEDISRLSEPHPVIE